MTTASMTVLNCSPTGILRVEARSVLVDFRSPREAEEFMKALEDAKLAKADPVASGERARRMLEYDEFATPSVE